jgi:type I restriction enzyme S subunit
MHNDADGNNWRGNVGFHYVLPDLQLLEQENQHLTQLRDWLLPMLMNGQVTVA